MNTPIEAFGTPDDWLMRSFVTILAMLFHFSNESIEMAAYMSATDIELAPHIMMIVWATIRKASCGNAYNYLQPFDLSDETKTEGTEPPNLVMCKVIQRMIRSILEGIATCVHDWEGIRIWIDQFINSGINTEPPFTDTDIGHCHWWRVNAIITNAFRTLSTKKWYRAMCYAHSDDSINIRSLLSLCDGGMMRRVLKWLHDNNKMPQAISSDHIATIMRTMTRHDSLRWTYWWLSPYVMADIYGKPREYWDRFKAHPQFSLEYAIVDHLTYQCSVVELVADQFPTEIARMIAVYQSDGCWWA